MLASCNRRMADAAANLILLAMVILLCSRLCLDICCCCSKQAPLLASLQSGPGHIQAAATHQHSRISRVGMAASCSKPGWPPGLPGCVSAACSSVWELLSACKPDTSLRVMLCMQRALADAFMLVECAARPLAPDTRRLPDLSGTVLLAPWAAHRALQCLLVHVTWEPKALSLASLQAPERGRPGNLLQPIACTELIDQVDFSKSSYLSSGQHCNSPESNSGPQNREAGQSVRWSFSGLGTGCGRPLTS